ncbi:DUF5916 domain-containing protein [Undibacterium cyanobacteriorum]|uniref:DUF5916 domain-containing protein n=1 Tax=Undibacterium cyanobacteriorum TaxID=3073561 RepID=A0ABY9RH53_9BURK|nr:DUF5916 domain-containing protein [Undibacterium sp. 20NA77.5]WMW80557.1 DUF5916 domain-containing protein [Undibacterium sp. 20NA77.5]
MVFLSLRSRTILRTITLTCLLLAGFNTRLEAQQTIPRVDRAPTIADYRNTAETTHKAGLEVNEFTVTSPRDGAKPTYATKAYLSYDDRNLYAIFVATANPNYLIARHTKRESTGGEDYVMLQIDTFNDQQRAFVFYANPLGVQADSLFIEGKDEDFDFDTQWHSEGEVSDTGYIVKFAIPFKSLRFANGEQQRWGISLARYSTEVSEFATWPHISRKKPSIVDQFAPVVIKHQLASNNQFQWIPYLLTSSSSVLDPQLAQGQARRAFIDRHQTQMGFDAKYVWNNAISFDMTVKPDFSDVESDEPQVTVDKRFETLITERRPFFIENGGFFRTPIPLFFSRRIAQPQFGLRATGRHADYAFGALLIDDQEGLPQQKQEIAIVRGQKDILGTGNVGFLSINKSSANAKNQIHGLDLHLPFGEHWRLNGQFAQSSSHLRQPDQTTPSTATSRQHVQANLAYVDLLYADSQWKYLGKLQSIESDFEAPLGFLPRRGIQQSEQSLAYTQYGTEHSSFLSQNIKFNLTNTTNQQQQFLDRRTEVLYTAKAKAANTFTMQLVRQVERLGSEDVLTQGWLAGWNSKTWPQLSTTLSFGKKQAPNYSFTSTQYLRGQASNVQAKFLWTPGRHWSFEETFFLTRLENEATRIYRDKLARTSINYQFNNQLGINAIFDYHELQSNPLMSTLKSNKTLNSSLQLRYVLSPGTSMFVNYVDRREGLSSFVNSSGFFETRPSADLDLRTGKSLSVKLNYLF